MKPFHVALSLVFLAGSDLSCFAQASTVTTYAGLGQVLAVSGTPAITQAIGVPSSVLPDLTGVFYFASLNHHRIYHVSAGGRFSN